jgi:hypothetical protein
MTGPGQVDVDHNQLQDNGTRWYRLAPELDGTTQQPTSGSGPWPSVIGVHAVSGAAQGVMAGQQSHLTALAGQSAANGADYGKAESENTGAMKDRVGAMTATVKDLLGAGTSGVQAAVSGTASAEQALVSGAASALNSGVSAAGSAATSAAAAASKAAPPAPQAGIAAGTGTAAAPAATDTSEHRNDQQSQQQEDHHVRHN